MRDCSDIKLIQIISNLFSTNESVRFHEVGQVLLKSFFYDFKNPQLSLLLTQSSSLNEII